MKHQRFGGDWTQEKLERVRKYLSAYTTIFATNPRARHLKPVYVDAFAGSGYRANKRKKFATNDVFPEFADTDTQAFVKGSVRIALEVDPPFKGYLLIERDDAYAEQLQNLKDEFPDKAPIIQIVRADANEYLKRWCATTDWDHTRAVVFLDPYGMQVDWTVIQAIAATKAIDLWILFPIGMAVNRLLTTGRPPPEEWREALTRIFGTAEWEKAFYKTEPRADLFDEETLQHVKLADFKKIGEFFVSRLNTIFVGVSDKQLPLLNSKNNPLYLLCFASANPKGSRTAIRIANDILKD